MTAILLILAALAVSLAVVLVSPTRCCARCRGERVTRSVWNGRIIGCPRCKGTGRHYRRGAAVVHRAFHALRAALADQRQQRASELGRGAQQ